jgi:cold shock CspA family protein
VAWGTITNLTTNRGFGYILPEGRAVSGNDLFFNRKDVQGATAFEQLQAGQRVEYEVGQDQRRGTPLAKNVRAVLQP